MLRGWSRYIHHFEFDLWVRSAIQSCEMCVCVLFLRTTQLSISFIPSALFGALTQHPPRLPSFFYTFLNTFRFFSHCCSFENFSKYFFEIYFWIFLILKKFKSALKAKNIFILPSIKITKDFFFVHAITRVYALNWILKLTEFFPTVAYFDKSIEIVYHERVT